MNIKKDIFWRVYLSFFLILLLGVGILYQVFRIQYIQGEEWRAMADSLTTRFMSIEPVRGNILSSDGSLMAASMPVYEIRMDPNTEALTDEIFYEKVDSLAWHLANYFGDKSEAEYRRFLREGRAQGNRYLLLRRSVNHHQLRDIRQFPLLRKGRYKGGLIVEQRTARLNPFQKLARRTVGYHTEHIRPVGLEGAYNEYLSGKEGKRLMQRVAGGVWIPINDDNELDPKDGKDVITTIDMNIQDVAGNALERQLKNHDALHGTAVVMEVSTGRIKAIANLKKSKRGGYRELYNFAVGESSEPGSTFKLASTLALMEIAGVNPGDSIDTKDGIVEFYDREMRDHNHREGGFGKISFEDAFAYSSNVAFSKLVTENFERNPSRFTDYLREIRLNQPLNIPIAGEGDPLIKSPSDRDWSGTTLPWMSIGYEVQLTPLQTLTFYNAIANNGEMVKPLFVDRIMDVGRVYKAFDKEVIHPRIASNSTIQKTRKLLESVTERGTASNLKTPNYSIAGKTGTALIASPEGYGAGSDKVYQASFAGYFPAENPQYSIIAVINGPSKGVYQGGQVAGPVFREIADKIFANSMTLHMAMDQQGEESKDKKHLPSAAGPGYGKHMTGIFEQLDLPIEEWPAERDWVSGTMQDSMLVFNIRDFSTEEVPDVRGMVVSDAIYLLENRGLNVNTNGTGRVVSQSVIPGTRTTAGREITLTLN